MTVASSAEPYRLIFNCDGHAVFIDAKGDTEQWLRNLFDPLEGSHVDALFWCDGAGGNTANYDSQVLERNGQRIGKLNPHVTRLIEEGNDPPKLVIREARKRKIDVFYSFRFNDIHDSFIPAEFPTFKEKHPEWMLGKQKYGSVTSYPTALNFALKEVRDLKFQVVKDIFSQYDFDGLEIDFLRGAPYFLPDQIQENAPLLTGLLKRIRNELNERGRERGRPIRLAVRVDETLRGCRQDGFEVKRWIDEGLVDMIILGSGVIDIDVGAFKQLTRGTEVTVHPCLYGWPSKYMPIPRDMACASALNYWAQGADGLYLFNWFPHQKNNSEATGAYQQELLRKLGDPQKILAGEHNYLFAADRGRPAAEHPGNWLDCILPMELKRGGATVFRLRTTGLPTNTTAAQIRLQFDDPVQASSVSARIHETDLKLHGASSNVLTATLSSDKLLRGDNQVRVSLSAGQATLRAAEVRLRYERPPLAWLQRPTPKTATVEIDPKAGPVLRYAAQELRRNLRELFSIDVVTKDGEATFRLRSDGGTGQAFKITTGESIKIQGDSDASVMWAVYELVEAWGVQFELDRDVLPRTPSFSLPTNVVRKKPRLPVRQWRVMNDFACGPESWGFDDYHKTIDQLAKLKFNRLYISIYPWQPFLDLKYQGVEREKAWLWYGYDFPITDDMPGRHLFGDQKTFWNPDLPPPDDYQAFHRASKRLLRQIIDHAHKRGMEVALTAGLFEFPPEFRDTLKHSQKVHQLNELTIVPGAQTPLEDPQLLDLATAVVEQTIETYPKADFLMLWAPEFRQWKSHYERAWKDLHERYRWPDTLTLEGMLEKAATRKNYSGGLERVRDEIQGDIVVLWFYDRVLRRVTSKPGGSQPKIVYGHVTEELFPLLRYVMPAGSEALSTIDYTPTRIVNRKEVMNEVDTRHVPASLIFTLHDDNIGVIPQLMTEPLSELLEHMAMIGWSGFCTRYWQTTDHHWTIAYLAEASWTPDVSPEDIYRRRLLREVGPAATEPALAMLQRLQQVTTELETNSVWLSFPVPNMMSKHWISNPLPEAVAAARVGYRQALRLAQEASSLSPEDSKWLKYWKGRLEFGIGYIDTVEAVRKAGPAEKAGDAQSARRHAEAALKSATAAIESYASVARNQSDRGAIATMGEFVYRYLKQKLEK
ncbi:MAG: hypothetical protein CMO80_13265 [Verrucomicrobiales bacterium]|nr:hypothetical protein [Verrucomicrobiales bacterium]